MGLALGLALGLELGLRRGRAGARARGAWRVAYGVWRVVCVAPEDLLVLEFGPVRAHLRRGRQRRRLRGGRA